MPTGHGVCSKRPDDFVRASTRVLAKTMTSRNLSRRLERLEDSLLQRMPLRAAGRAASRGSAACVLRAEFFTGQERTHRVLPAQPSRPRAFRKLLLPTGSLGPNL